MNFLNTFRGRLLLILALLLMATLGVQYYLNLVTQRDNEKLRDEQTRALVTGIALGSNGITSREYMSDFVQREDQPFFDEAIKARIKDIMVIDESWQIADSLDESIGPRFDDAGNAVYTQLSQIKGLPRLAEADRIGTDVQYFPVDPNIDAATSELEAHAIPIETSKGRWYVVVILKNDKDKAAWRAAQPLVYTLGVLLVSSLITFLLVFRFTRPIADLTTAARHIADGDLSVRVDGSKTNELGRLALNFNEMTAELEKKRELEAQLQQAEKSAVVGRLGSAIAHEIRNPLNYINLTLDHLRKKFAPEDEEKRATFEKLTSQLKDEVARINSQISDFLNYSRPANAELRPISARETVEESLRIVEAQAAESNITIGIIEHEDVPQILGDPEFLRSVFNNLFINAIQAMESSGGHLGIKILPDGEMVRFEISDTGPGISPENVAMIFEPYFSTKETGTGLGLAIVQKIVDIHNGSISVQSIQGGGTTFTLKLQSVKRICPACNRFYTDETLTFCRDDGTVLIDFAPSANQTARDLTIRATSNIEFPSEQ